MATKKKKKKKELPPRTSTIWSTLVIMSYYHLCRRTFMDGKKYVVSSSLIHAKRLQNEYFSPNIINHILGQIAKIREVPRITWCSSIYCERLQSGVSLAQQQYFHSILDPHPLSWSACHKIIVDEKIMWFGDAKLLISQ